MASKSSSTGPNLTTATSAAKPTRSRKTTTQTKDVGRAGSAGGIVSEKGKELKSKIRPAPKPTQPQDQAKPEDPASKTPRRKPRKLNKEPTPTTPRKEPVAPSPSTPNEIEALKSRVRGLEAKVEDLYKSGNLDRAPHSPRRRGRGKKTSSQQVPTISNTKDPVSADDLGRTDEEKETESLMHLEKELEITRHHLSTLQGSAKHGAKSTTTTTIESETAADDDDENENDNEEEIYSLPRSPPPPKNQNQLTLSGSYHIPLPASLSLHDVQNIQSGITAAHTLARNFWDRRRQPSSSSAEAGSSMHVSSGHVVAPSAVRSNLEVLDKGRRWSEWVGGYSLAVGRLGREGEYEAAVGRKGGTSGGGGGGGGGNQGKRGGK